ncbi:unnamed protein product [Oikopleura dioica]|uniref:Phosphorylase b kinase regulatory subunit n=1 Tax=Oikopleura dioica TaxID=34765 RepID=E4YSW8_OIKDI|nr:unnamed protein product [Oikopleura dioica]
MLIRGQPTLFNDLLRLRVGLIVQVLASELARLFNCSGQEASSCLLALPPSELKTLLHSLLSGHEIAIAQDGKKRIRARSNSRTRRGSIVSPFTERGRMLNEAYSSNRARSGDRLSRQDSTHQSLMLTLGGINSEIVVEDPGQRAGSWLRRRQLDGALNRVATDFYIWQVLDRCHGLQIGGRLIQGTVTREMTSSELKFALLVENTLNGIPEPERRQMVVEALSVLSMLASFQLPLVIILSTLTAEKFFREDQTLEGIQSEATHEDFYDSAPTGRFGTMAYLVRACTEMLEKEAEQGESKHCAVQ